MTGWSRVALAASWIESTGGAAVIGNSENLAPLFDNAAKGLLGLLIMVPFMSIGFDVIPQSAE